MSDFETALFHEEIQALALKFKLLAFNYSVLKRDNGQLELSSNTWIGAEMTPEQHQALNEVTTLNGKAFGAFCRLVY